MKNKLLEYLLLATVFFSVFCFFASAKEQKVELSIISANVSGLPKTFSKYDRDVQKSQETLGKMLNESGYDIICVQEDFQYHDTLAAEMTAYPYFTYTSGGVPVGDGLNIFSKYPIYNVERIAWKKYNGVFSDGSDALTPKGFIKCTVDINGVLIDLFNLHCDAYRTDADQYAKKAQLIQLTEYLEKNSKDNAIIITGDTNLTFHNDPLSEMHRIMIVENGYTDCWVEMKNDGNYMQGEDGRQIIEAWYDKFGGHDWGRWDSVERVLYKNSDSIKIKPTYFEHKIYTDNEKEIKALTDHRIMECVVEIDFSEYEKPANISLTKVKKPSFLQKFFRASGMLLRFVFVLVMGILQLIFSNIYSAILFVTTIVSIVYLCLSKKFKKKGR